MRKTVRLLALFLTIVHPLAACDNRAFKEAVDQPFVAEPSSSDLAMTFFGTSSFLLRTSQSQIMIDGYVSREWHYFVRPVAPNFGEVRRVLKQHNVRCIVISCARPGQPLDLVLPLHGHYDHAMDSSLIAGWTGAARLSNPSLDQMHEATAEWAAENQTPFQKNGPKLEIASKPSFYAQPKLYGDVSVQVIATPHNKNIFSNQLAKKTLDSFKFPSQVTKMGEGTSLSVLITHQGKKALIIGSSGIVGNRFDGVEAEVVFLSIGGLRPKRAKEFWCNTVEAVGAQRVYLTHWDNHQKRLPKDGTPLEPTFFEPHSDILKEFQTLARGSVEIAIPAAQVHFNPFADLPGATRYDKHPQC